MANFYFDQLLVREIDNAFCAFSLGSGDLYSLGTDGFIIRLMTTCCRDELNVSFQRSLETYALSHYRS